MTYLNVFTSVLRKSCQHRHLMSSQGNIFLQFILVLKLTEKLFWVRPPDHLLSRQLLFIIIHLDQSMKANLNHMLYSCKWEGGFCRISAPFYGRIFDQDQNGPLSNTQKIWSTAKSHVDQSG